ncbi:hypothetical protein [Actinocrispum sp. NPDC049592]|uniref:hypothetical protein n=1 Tax=Actinocrispum sp. NPDC049592 TaxID=3154835 RepID=UPI0034368CD7
MDFAWTDPSSDIVILTGGPRDQRGYFYRDWLATRRSSRLGRYPLDHPCGASRCYAPTTETSTTANKLTRVWRYVSTAQWTEWGHEYLTPEERSAAKRDNPAIQGDVTAA